MIPTEGRLTFGRFAVDWETRSLSNAGFQVPLQEKPLRLLLALVAQEGKVASRALLYDSLWGPEVHVDREAGLNTAVRKLRSALRKVSPESGEILVTVPRVGYRLALKEDSASLNPPAPPSRPSKAPASRYQWVRSPRLMLAMGLIALAVFAVLGSALLRRGSEGRATELMPQDAELRSRYVEARSQLGAVGGDLERAQNLLRSVTIDLPEFAPAHAYLAEAAAREALQSNDPGKLLEPRQAAHRALALDPRSPVAHRALAMIALNFDWDLAKAGTHLDRALALDPSDPINHLAQAVFFSAYGKHQDAIAAIQRAVDLDPDSMSIRSDAGFFLLRAGRFAEAASECGMVLRLDSSSLFARECLLAAHGVRGEMELARPHALELLRRGGASQDELEQALLAEDPRRFFLAWNLEQILVRSDPPAVEIAIAYLSLGKESEALSWLERAVRQRSPLLVLVPQHTEFLRIQGHPHYQRILREAGLESLAPALATVAMGLVGGPDQVEVRD